MRLPVGLHIACFPWAGLSSELPGKFDKAHNPGLYARISDLVFLGWGQYLPVLSRFPRWCWWSDSSGFGSRTAEITHSSFLSHKLLSPWVRYKPWISSSKSPAASSQVCSHKSSEDTEDWAWASPHPDSHSTHHRNSQRRACPSGCRGTCLPALLLLQAVGCTPLPPTGGRNHWSCFQGKIKMWLTSFGWLTPSVVRVIHSPWHDWNELLPLPNMEGCSPPRKCWGIWGLRA